MTFWRTGVAVSFQIFAMLRDQVVDAPTERGEQFIVPNVLRAQDRVNSACRTNLLCNGNVDREISHPI